MPFDLKFANILYKVMSTNEHEINSISEQHVSSRWSVTLNVIDCCFRCIKDAFGIHATRGDCIQPLGYIA